MSDLRAIILVNDTVQPVYEHFSPFQLAILQLIISKLLIPGGLTINETRNAIDIDAAELKTILFDLQLTYSYRQIIDQMSDLMEPHEYLFSTDRYNTYCEPHYDRLLCCLLCGVLFKEGTGAMNLMVTPYLLDYLLHFETTGFTVSVPTSTAIPISEPTSAPVSPGGGAQKRPHPQNGVTQKSKLQKTPSMTLPAMGQQQTRPPGPLPPKVRDDESHSLRLAAYQRLLIVLTRLGEREADPNPMLATLLDASPDLSLTDLTQLYSLIAPAVSSHHLSPLLEKAGFVLPPAHQSRQRAFARTMNTVIESLKPDEEPLPSHFVTISRPDPILNSQPDGREPKKQWWVKSS